LPARSLLNKVALTEPRHLKTLVENRRVFNLDKCELNVFETYQEAYRVPLQFKEFVITSMVRGKKVMHLFDKPAFDYHPGETVIVPANECMAIDFPEAEQQNPTQCIALAVDHGYVNHTLNFLNNYYTNDEDREHRWSLQYNQYHFANNNDISDLINKLIRVCSSTDKAKNIYADLNLKELLIRLVQSQHLVQVDTEKETHRNHSRLHFVLHYIHENLTDRILVDKLCQKAYMSRNQFYQWFRQQFGLTPLEYINRERLKMAKQMLADTRNSISDVAYQCGFADVNYFVRLFKLKEGITPGSYRTCMG
jgi:AraC-like DNA-binding protein